MKIDMKIINWLKESNRYKHIIGGMFVTLSYIIVTKFIPGEFIVSIIAAGCLELKDKLNGNKWDWIDFLVTVIGGELIILLLCLF